MPIFRVKSVKIYTGQKNLHEYTRGARDKYEVCFSAIRSGRLKDHMRKHSEENALNVSMQQFIYIA